MFATYRGAVEQGFCHMILVVETRVDDYRYSRERRQQCAPCYGYFFVRQLDVIEDGITLSNLDLEFLI